MLKETIYIHILTNKQQNFLKKQQVMIARKGWNSKLEIPNVLFISEVDR